MCSGLRMGQLPSGGSSSVLSVPQSATTYRPNGTHLISIRHHRSFAPGQMSTRTWFWEPPNILLHHFPSACLQLYYRSAWNGVRETRANKAIWMGAK